jgi:hypothetical protein
MTRLANALEFLSQAARKFPPKMIVIPSTPNRMDIEMMAIAERRKLEIGGFELIVPGLAPAAADYIQGDTATEIDAKKVIRHLVRLFVGTRANGVAEQLGRIRFRLSRPGMGANARYFLKADMELNQRVKALAEVLGFGHIDFEFQLAYRTPSTGELATTTIVFPASMTFAAGDYPLDSAMATVIRRLSGFSANSALDTMAQIVVRYPSGELSPR